MNNYETEGILQFDYIYGVDFSGARLAGKNTWIACLGQVSSGLEEHYELTGLVNLEQECGTAARETVLQHLVQLISDSHSALWAMDFPFALPIEVMDVGAQWADQFDFIRNWGDARSASLECVRRSESSLGRKHVRRLTDSEEKAPFDPYHYRIMYQTFHGMRDVLSPLRQHLGVAILPFEYENLTCAKRVVVEACPSSTLKHLSLPHHNYKQTKSGALTPKRIKTRRLILLGVERYVKISDTFRRVIMHNNGGDALDAVIAALGAATAWKSSNHKLIAIHSRYSREGKLYV